MSRTTAVVLAGGSSRRMARDKREIRLFPASPTFLERTAAVGRAVADRVVMVGGPRDSSAGRNGLHLDDRWPNSGPLGGFLTALDAFPEDRLLVLACDYPLLQVDLARHLLDASDGHHAVVPRRPSGESSTTHPLVACYDAARCLPITRVLFDEGHRSMMSLLGRVVVRWLDRWHDEEVAHLSLTNINTARELDTVRALALERDGSLVRRPSSGRSALPRDAV